MPSPEFPLMQLIRQAFPPSPTLQIHQQMKSALTRVVQVSPGARVAVAVGSRGISNLQQIVSAVIDHLKGLRAVPFIVPAMGSHGGATPEGQMGLLAEYGITEKNLGVPIHASMDVAGTGQTEDGVDVFCSKEALSSDGVIVINRIKPHTDFKGTLGSGLLKMLVIGLGKRAGAANFHVQASRFGYEHVIRTSARVTLRKLKVICGVGIIEDQRHQTARIAVIPGAEIEPRENELFQEASRLMPKLPFDDIDLLIVDRLGKNISGAGMDPNIIGRGVHGYTSLLSERSARPAIHRLFVRDLTPETHGNAIGIGSADFTTDRLVASMDQRVTAINALTALTVLSSKIPIHFATDREAVDAALDSLALKDRTAARVMRIRDTLSLETVQVSRGFVGNGKLAPGLEILGEPQPLRFSPDGNLEALPQLQ